MQQEEYKYIAFISYSNANLLEASQLKKRLRKFRLPSFMKDASMSSVHLSVFMADTDFNEHKVQDGLHKKLDESQYLIIVCSPESAKSTYCEEEVSYFIRTGKADRIIPYIISGHPNAADPSDECYVESLKQLPKDQQISGIYIPMVGKYNGYLMAVSRLLHLEYDAIKVEDWRRRFTNFIILSIVSVLFISIGLFAAFYYLPHYKYYVDYVDKNGLPEGILQVNSQEDRNHRPFTYKFEYRQNRLFSTSYVDSYGNRVEHQTTETLSRPCVREFQYTKRGGLEIICKNSTGQILWVEVVSPDRTSVGIKQYESDQGMAVMKSFSDLTAQYGMNNMAEFDVQHVYETTKSTIRGYQLTRDYDGYILRKLFSSSSDNTSDEPGRDENGIEGLLYELDSLHRITKISYIKADGTIISDKMGISSKNYSYDDYGNLTRIECRDLRDSLAINADYWAVGVIEFNRYGQPLVQTYYDSHYLLSNDKLGVALKRWKWNERGLLMESSFFNDKEEPVNVMPNDKNIPISHRCTFTYNKYGRQSEMRCYNIDNAPIKIGCATYFSFDFDKEGHLIEIASKDENGNPAYNVNGISTARVSYLANNPVRTECFDVKGRYINNTEGYAYVTRQYDKHNRLTKEEYFNKFGGRIPNQRLGGACGVKLEYNERSGNLEKCTFLDMSGEPARNSQGLEIVCSKYNSQGLCVEEKNTSKDGDIYAIQRFEYDKYGHRTSVIWLDKNGNLSDASQLGCAILLIDYNDNGQIIAQKTLDSNKKLVVNNQGWAILRNSFYNDNGKKVISSSFYNQNDNPIIPKNIGAHQFICKFTRDKCDEVECYDIYGKRMRNTLYGAWKKTMEYSQYGFPAHSTLFDINGEKINGSDGNCEEVVEYSGNGFGWPLSISLYDKSGNRAMSVSQGISYVKNEYLFNGIQCGTAFFDNNCKPINGPQGYHSVLFHYDSNFNIYTQECRDSDSTLTWCPLWDAVAVEYAYDPDGQCTYMAVISDRQGEFSQRMILLDTLDYPRYVREDYWGNYAFGDGFSNIDYEVKDYSQLDAIIEGRIESYKRQYSDNEGIDYLKFENE